MKRVDGDAPVCLTRQRQPSGYARYRGATKIAEGPRHRLTAATARAVVHSCLLPPLHKASRGDGRLADDKSATQVGQHRGAHRASHSRLQLAAGLGGLHRLGQMVRPVEAAIRRLRRPLTRQTEILALTARDRLYRSATNAGKSYDQAKGRRLWGSDRFAPARSAIAGCQHPASRGRALRPPSRDRRDEHSATSGMPIKPYRSGNNRRPTESREELWDMVPRAIENAM